ncbi:hypothetical protein [Sphingobium lignivorans]|uniref:Holin n=1 Tax=Sphingobium lignivorans TaxID=2735886 RepID=A0ABR6NF94_9SPHN|nr:hypothetical protein [Sphingobium lignivorans]MBB5985945.1 hypothetical protein [Sphingobium lignivorans]
MSFIDRIRDRMADGWETAYRWASIRISAAGLTIFSVLAAFPGLVSEMWNALPPPLRDRLPDNFGYVVAAVIFAGTIAGRLHKRKDRNDG